MMLVIYGPTATGKTDLALKLAHKLNGELISADSRQVYRKLDIGTGKISFSSKVEKFENYWVVDNVKIHGFDIKNPSEEFSVAGFLKMADDAIANITHQSKLPIVVGGTGFYIKALLEGVDTIGISKSKKLRKELEKLSVNKLFQKLKQLDFQKAQNMNQSDRNNPRRLVRAIEISSSQKITNFAKPAIGFQMICLTAPNEFLYKRADKWLETRLKKGMVEEIQNLLDTVDHKWLDNLGLEYRWITRYLLGKISKDEAVSRLKSDIHSFIRRQKTWFNQFHKIELFDISQPDWKISLEDKVKNWYISLATDILKKNGPKVTN